MESFCLSPPCLLLQSNFSQAECRQIRRFPEFQVFLFPTLLSSFERSHPLGVLRKGRQQVSVLRLYISENIFLSLSTDSAAEHRITGWKDFHQALDGTDLLPFAF